MTLSYTQGLEPKEADVTWTDDGEELDLTGAVVTLDVFQFGSSTIFAKTDGFVGQAPVDEDGNEQPNLLITWADKDSDAELVTLDVGRFVVHFQAVVAGETFDLYDELIVSPPVANRGYCDATDLKLGGVAPKSSWNAYEQINEAADEMNAKIGRRYALPLNLSLAAGFVPLTLKSINADLASGRYLLENNQNNDRNVHAYGAQLVRDAMAQIDAIVCGQVQLMGVPGLVGSNKSLAPGIRNHDAHSLVDGFERYAHRGHVFEFVRPGPAEPWPLEDIEEEIWPIENRD